MASQKKRASKKSKSLARAAVEKSAGTEIQHFGDIAAYPLALADRAKEKSIEHINRLLAETLVLRDMYKKHHWQVSGPTFEQLHLLFDKHYEAQVDIVDTLAERVQMLGGISIAMPHDVLEISTLPRPPKGRETPYAQIVRLLHAHEHILKLARVAARVAGDAGDDGSNDMIVGSVIRPNEMQVWFLNAHLHGVPVVQRK